MIAAIAATRLAPQAQAQRVEAAKGAYWPGISLSASYSRTTNASNAQTTATPFDLLTGGAAVHQELFNFGRTDAQVASARATLEATVGQQQLSAVEVAHQARRAFVGWVQAQGLEGQAAEQRKANERLQEQSAQQDYETQRQAVELNIDQAYMGVQGAAAKLPAVTAELASARENVYQAEGRYRAGVGSIIEVSDAEAQLAVAEGDQVHALAAYHLAIADLIADLGTTGAHP